MARREKMRSLHSLLISLNLHIWGFGLFSLVFAASRPEPSPRRIEVQLLQLPAAVAGASAGISPDREYPDRASRDRRRGQSAGLRCNADRRAQTQKRRGPRVTHRVRVAKTASPIEATPPGTWSPASPLRVARSAVQAQGARISGASPEAPPRAVRPSPTSRPPEPVSDYGSLATDHGSHTADHRLLTLDDSIGGDTRTLIEIIQARIDAVTPLVHASSGPCQTQKGVVRLRFVVNLAGYPCGYRIVTSSGVHCLDDEVDNVLHMAEPYPYVAGWIPVTVRFAPRTRI
jgi:hypothetical protein